MAPAFVLLHGFSNTGASWAPVIEALAGRYRALAPDIRGHGAARDRRPVRLDAVLSDLDTLAEGPLELAGYSMGGRIALHAALAPGLGERIERLTLLGASPGLADAGERAARRAADERLAAEVEASTIEAFAERWARTPVLSGLPRTLAGQVHEDRLRNAPPGGVAHGLAAALRGLGTGALPSLWGRLGELRMPVTLVAGERDEKFSAIAHEMALRIPKARVEIVAGAGHAAHIEQPGAVARLLIGGAGDN